METKTFPYAVIWNGEIVPPHTPIPVAPKIEATEKPKVKKGAKKNEARGTGEA